MTYEESDPKTVEALDKIKAILTEYDLFAAFTVVSSERVHWLYHTDPSWSCLSINMETGKAHIKAKAVDFATKHQHQRVVELTTGAIISCKDMAAKQFGDFRDLEKLLGKEMEITHTYGDAQLRGKR